ncbi:MAG: hypothetical protein ACKOFY_01965 [Candidatus Limnocylindrus sp.]
MTPANREERTLKPGDVVASRYRLQELIGEGAAALVFRATDEALGRDVAVKVLRAPLATLTQLPIESVPRVELQRSLHIRTLSPSLTLRQRVNRPQS